MQRARHSPPPVCATTVQRIIYADVQVRFEPGRPRETLSDLAMECKLAPGQVLVLTCDAQREGSLGRYFFTDTSRDRLEQKLLCIRLSQTQLDDRFATEGE